MTLRYGQCIRPSLQLGEIPEALNHVNFIAALLKNLSGWPLLMFNELKLEEGWICRNSSDFSGTEGCDVFDHLFCSRNQMKCFPVVTSWSHWRSILQPWTLKKEGTGYAIRVSCRLQVIKPGNSLVLSVSSTPASVFSQVVPHLPFNLLFHRSDVLEGVIVRRARIFHLF